MMIFPQCFSCKHYRGASMKTEPLTCKAFPDGSGIPDAILRARHDHAEPYDGDHGIRFEPKDAETETEGTDE